MTQLISSLQMINRPLSLFLLILFIGFPASSLVNVYTLSGQRYAVYSIDETGCLTIPFDDYPAGTYLFNVNQISYKLIKK